MGNVHILEVNGSALNAGIGYKQQPTKEQKEAVGEIVLKLCLGLE
jgi:hypothetical protein